MAGANASNQILLDLLGRKGYNEWFSVVLPGDEDALSIAALSSSKTLWKRRWHNLQNGTTITGRFSEFNILRLLFRMKLFSKMPLIHWLLSTGISSQGTPAIPAKSCQRTAYCVRLWDEWVSFRNGRPGTSTSYVPSLIQVANDPPNLQYWLSRFVWKQGKRMGLNSHRIHFTTSSVAWCNTFVTMATLRLTSSRNQLMPNSARLLTQKWKVCKERTGVKS